VRFVKVVALSILVAPVFVVLLAAEIAMVALPVWMMYEVVRWVIGR
jgi:hypothetical protein